MSILLCSIFATALSTAAYNEDQVVRRLSLRDQKGKMVFFYEKVAKPLLKFLQDIYLSEDDEGEAETSEDEETSKKPSAFDTLSALCTEPQELIVTFPLTPEGTGHERSFYREIIKEYNKCSRFYEGLSDNIEIEIGSIVDDSISVHCFSCPDSTISCEDIRDHFLDETLCFPKDAKGTFKANKKTGFKAGKCQSGETSSKTLTLPKTFAPDESSLFDFLECRSNMGAYDTHGNLWSSVEFTKVSQVGDNLEVTCHDPCSNHAICDDIVEQYESDLVCVSNYEDCEPTEIKYELTFLDGGVFESKSRRYTREVESKLEENLHDYITCRFQDDENFDASEFTVYGNLEGNTYSSICFNDCGTIPYCDALQIRKEDDSRNDPCYVRSIEADPNARVITVYDYDLEYDVAGNTQSFSYNVQSVSNDPLVRQYYGQTTSSNLPSISTSEAQIQKENLLDLMRGYGFSETDEPDYLFNNLCHDLDEHVECKSNNRIDKIDIEIPNGVGFRANDVKNYFGDYLETLILGIQLTVSKSLPSQFFDIPSLRTLTIRARGKLKGSISTSIGNMVSLKDLDFNQCDAPSAPSGTHPTLTGTIPTEIKTPPLKLIDLGCNQISGTIPSEFYEKVNGNLKGYRVINLNDNNLSGTIGNSLSYTTTLTQLSLANNGFSSWIALPSRLTNLQLIDLHGNSFEQGLHTFGILKQSTSLLEIVSLNDNNIKGTIPPEIGQLQHLEYLNLSNNNIKGTIPSELALLTNLKVLLLEGNPRLDNSVPTVLQTFLTANNVVHDLTW